MAIPALYDTLYSFKDIHKVILDLAHDLNDEQLNWKPEGYSTSIGFHLWHLARESDMLKLPSSTITRSLFQSLAMEKRSGQKRVLLTSGVFPRNWRKQWGQA